MTALERAVAILEFLTLRVVFMCVSKRAVARTFSTLGMLQPSTLPLYVGVLHAWTQLSSFTFSVYYFYSDK